MTTRRTLRQLLLPHLPSRTRTAQGALSTGLSEGAPVLPQDSGWKSLAHFGVAAEPLDVLEQQRRVERLWLTHPLVGQIVGLMCDFTVGAGMSVTVREESAADALDELVAAQIGWAGLPRAAAAHLAVYGEVFLAVRDPGGDFIADHARRPPRLELIPPMEVRRVVLRPDGSLAGILREYATPSPVDVAHLERDPRSGLFPQALRMAVEFIAGERIVHVTAQAGAPGVRGVPPLARVIPWVEQYDQWLMDRVRINRARGAFAFLRKVPGWGIDPANPAASATDQQKVPKPGSVLVVSDQESWEVLEPRVGADDASSDGRALKLMVLAGAGIAEHYLGDLAQSNLATARAAELPMLKRFEAHQLQVLALFQDALQRALGMMGFSAQVSCTLPHPGVTDALALTRTLKEQLALGLISPQTARSLIPWITDVAEEERRIAQHQEEADH